MSDIADRLSLLRSELDDHARVAEHLGLDLERPLRALRDGYPETTVALIGTLCERLLKQLWRHHKVEGDPDSRGLNDLIKRTRPHIRSTGVLNALEDIRRLRNRAGHDAGAPVATEDGLAAVRRLVDVLAWFSSTGSPALAGTEPPLGPEVAARSEFLAGLYLTLGYRSAKRFVLTPDTVYQLFCRESGARLEYVELLLSRDADDLRHVLTTTGGELLRTRLPKLIRFVVLDEAHDAVRTLLGEEFRIIRYDGFVDTLIDFSAHLPAPQQVPPADRIPTPASVLAPDPRTGEPHISEAEDAEALLERLAQERVNVVLVGRSGSGKSTLLRSLVSPGPRRPGESQARPHRFRFYFDLSLKRPGESFAEYVYRLLAPCMPAERARAYDLFLYLIRSGAAVCALDAVDEGVAEPSPAGFLTLFAELAPVLSAESAVVMSSRVSFLADSPQVRQLLDRDAARSEQLVEQLYAQGVEPDRLPHCHLVRLTGQGATPLERQVTRAVEPDAFSPGAGRTLSALLDAHIRQVVGDAGQPALADVLQATLGREFLAGRTAFSLADLHRALGPEAFTGGRLEREACVLAPLLREANDGAEQYTFAHTAYQELLAARFLATEEGRRTADALPGAAFLTEQVRAFLASTPHVAGSTDDCVLPPGTYLVGPAERLLLRRIDRPVLFDRNQVTVARYRRFLDALDRDGTSEWDHPNQPAHITHVPWTDRLRDPAYYEDPRYSDHPAVCVNWWSAYAFSAFEGKRLPSALEWEAAARGTDGRLFPWGDDPDGAQVNCADAWVGHPVVTYQAWREEFTKDEVMRNAWVTPVGRRPDNRSPFGIEDMAGQVWEWTSTSLDDPGEAAICGGSYDNPLRAVQASSKGLYRKRGGSGAVGFRCVRDVGATADTGRSPREGA